MSSSAYSVSERGSILVFVLVFAITVGAAAAALVAESNAGLNLRKMENIQFGTLTDCLNGIDIAKNAIITSAYDTNDHNVALWSTDSTDDGTPGANPLIDNGRATVTVSYLGSFWYELRSTSTGSDGTVREIVLRVLERDFFSRYALFIENGDVRIGDTTSYYGPVHVNKNCIFNDSVSGVGAQVHGFMSSTVPFTFNGNAEAETVFHEGFADDLGKDGWIDIDTKAAGEYRDETGAVHPSGTSLWSTGTGGNKIEIRRGPTGFLVTGNVYTNIELIFDVGTQTQYIKFTLKDTSGTTIYTSSQVSDYEMMDPAIVNVEKTITGLKGEIHTAATVVSETADVNISGDLYYVDDEGDHPMIFDPANPANTNYLENPDYDGHAVLGVVAHQNVMYTGSEDDANLEINAAVIAVTGQVKWGGSGDKDHLRVFGARISDGQTYRYSGASGGYNNSGVYVYDQNLRVTPPPKFVPLQKPLFIGFQVVK